MVRGAFGGHVHHSLLRRLQWRGNEPGIDMKGLFVEAGIRRYDCPLKAINHRADTSYPYRKVGTPKASDPVTWRIFSLLLKRGKDITEAANRDTQML